MGLINADATFGQGALTFPTNLRTFIVGQSGQAVLQSSATNLVDIQELFIDNADIDVVGQNMVLLTERLLVNLGADPGTIPNVNFTNTHIQQSETLTDSPQFKCNLTAPGAIFQYTGGDAGTNGWGVYGPAGTTAVTWNIPGAQFWGQNNWSVLINALTQDSDLTGVRFVDATGNFGAYSELPFFDFVGLVHGNFTRTFGGGRFLWAVTGGPERASLSIGNNWSIMAQNDLSGFTAAGGTTNVGCDENVHVFLINQYRPTIPTGQTFDALRRQGTGNGQMTVAQGWNPVFVDTVGATVNTWRAFGYSGGDLSGTNFVLRPLPLRKDTSATPTTPDVPTGVASIAEGVLYNTTEQNGFLVIDQEFTISGIGVPLGGHPDKAIRVYDYNTQTGDEIGMDINLTFPSDGMNRVEALAAGQNINVQEITTSAPDAAGFINLGWAQEDRRTFSIDTNIPSTLTEAIANTSNLGQTSESTDLSNWYGLIKEFYIRNDLRDTTTWPLGASAGAELLVDRNLNFAAALADVTITDDTVTLRHGTQPFTALTPSSLKTTLRMTSGTNNVVNWGVRAFPSGITLVDGVHNCDYTRTGNNLNGINWIYDDSVTINLNSITAGEYAISEILGNPVDAIGTTTLTVNAPNAGGTVILHTTDPNLTSDWVQGTNVEFQVRLAPTQYQVSTGSLAGRVAVRNATTGQTIAGPMDVFANQPFEMSFDQDDDGINVGDTIRVYYKPTNTAMNGYTLSTAFDTVDDDRTGRIVPLVALPTIINSLLYIDPNEAPDPAGAATVEAISGGIRINITGMTDSNVTGRTTQRLLLPLTDELVYFRQLVDLDAQADYITAGFNSTSLQAGGVTLNSGTDGTVQMLRAVGGSPTIMGLTLNGTVQDGIPSVVLFLNPEGATVDDIRLAVDSSTTSTAVTAIQDATTALQSDIDVISPVVVQTESRVEAVERATGYMVGNGNPVTGDTPAERAASAAAARAGTRLTGIRPKSGDFDPNQSYEEIL